MSSTLLKIRFALIPGDLAGFYEAIIQVLFHSRRWLFCSPFSAPPGYPDSYTHWKRRISFKALTWPLVNVIQPYLTDQLVDKRPHIDDDCRQHAIIYPQPKVIQILYQPSLNDGFER